MKTGTPRARNNVFALLAALLAAFGLYRWAANDNAPVVSPSLTTSAPSVTASGREPARLSPVISSGGAGGPEASPQVGPPPPAFDFATLARSPHRGQSKNDEERFATNEWFKQEDLLHPERYFEVAEHVPELNRPEERRDTLEFFLAYREKLQRDLEARSDDSEKRQEILATIERYDSSISRLRELIDGEQAK